MRVSCNTRKGLKVVQTAPYFQAEIGSPEFYLCKGLSELQNEVHLVTSDVRRPGFHYKKYVTETWQKHIDSFHVHRFHTLFNISSVPFLDWQVSRFLLNLDFDVVHVHEIYYLHSIQSFQVARLKAKIFGASQDRYYYPKGLFGSFLSTYYHTIGRRIFNKCDFICATSTSAASFLRRIGVKQRIHLLPHSIDPDKFRPISKNKMKEKFNLHCDQVILYVGRLHEEKGVKYLVEAFKTIKKWHSDVLLVIIGEGSEKENLLYKAKKLGIQEATVFMDYLPHDRLPEIYSTCDVLVLPSIAEAFGMVLIEAMACHRPVIGSNIGGIKDIIDNGKNGFKVEPRKPKQLADKIHALLSDKQLQKRFGEEARRKVENTFSYKVVAEKASNIYKQAIEKKMMPKL